MLEERNKQHCDLCVKFRVDILAQLIYRTHEHSTNELIFVVGLLSRKDLNNEWEVGKILIHKWQLTVLHKLSIA